MANTPVTIDEFRGLNLEADITELGFRGACNILNIDFPNAPGLPARRPGTDRLSHKFADSGAQSPYGSLHWDPTENAFFTCYKDSSNLRLARMTPDGFVSSTLAHGTGSVSSLSGVRFASFGSDTSSYVFAAASEANGTDTVATYDVGADTWDGTPSYTGDEPDGAYLAVTPWDNRLVSAGGIGSNTTVHRVRFSTEGDPFTWGDDATDDFYVDLNPGDGEEIREVVVWGDLMFVFKQTKFYVFYGVGSTGGGDPIFNYRQVQGQGIPVAWDGQAPAACAGRDAVYFVNYEGVWRTTGGPPEKVSRAIDPLFQLSNPEQPSPYFTDIPSHDDGDEYCAITYLKDKIYVYGHDDKCLVYDTVDRWWSYWELPGMYDGSFLYALPERTSGEVSTNGHPPDLVYSTTVAGTNEYYRGHIFSISGDADKDYGGNMVTSLVATGGTAGTFTLNFDNGTTDDTTATLNWDDTAAEVETALKALDNVDAGDLFCEGGPLPDSPIYICMTTDGQYGNNAGDNVSITVTDEAVTNGNATIAGISDGDAGNGAIQCRWQSGAEDLGTDVPKIVKEVIVTADHGRVEVAIAADLLTMPTTQGETLSSVGVVRIRRGSCSTKGRLLSVKLENSTGSVDLSRVGWRRITLNMLGQFAGPQRDSIS